MPDRFTSIAAVTDTRQQARWLAAPTRSRSRLS